MLKALLIVFGLITFWVFWRNFLWPWLSNQIFFWKFSRDMRKWAKDIAKMDNPHAKKIAEMAEGLAESADACRRKNKL